LGRLVQEGFCRQDDNFHTKLLNDGLWFAEGSPNMNKRRVTKPSMWSEIDGSPGSYLVACPGECCFAHNSRLAQCVDCLPILVTPPEEQVVEGTTTPPVRSSWTAGPQESGACSFSVELDTAYFCGHPAVESHYTSTTDFENSCSAAPDIHAFPVLGNQEQPNELWHCKT